MVASEEMDVLSRLRSASAADTAAKYDEAELYDFLWVLLNMDLGDASLEPGEIPITEDGIL